VETGGKHWLVYVLLNSQLRAATEKKFVLTLYAISPRVSTRLLMIPSDAIRHSIKTLSSANYAIVAFDN